MRLKLKPHALRLTDKQSELNSGALGNAFFDASGDLAHNQGIFGGDLCGHIKHFGGQLDRRRTSATLRNADQLLLTPSFGSVVNGLVADWQGLANK